MNAEWPLRVGWCRIRPEGRGIAISIAAVVVAVGLVVLAAALIGNARIRHRHAATAVSVDALIADRLTHPAAAGRDLWEGISAALAAEVASERPTLAERLEVLCDRSESRPQLAGDIEVKEFHLRWGNDYALIANPRDLLHYRLEPGEVEILPLLDGSRTVKEIVVDRLQDSGDFELGGVADLVQQLKVGGFLTTPFLDVDAAVARAIAPESTLASKIKEFTKTLSVEWSGADRMVRWIHDHLLFWIFPGPVVAVLAAVAIGGAVAFLDVLHAGRFSFSGSAIAAASLVLIILDWVLTFCHELGHALVLVHQGRRVKSAGFMIYFGAPAFFVESSDGLMVDPPKRVRQSFAGPFAELFIAGVAGIYVWAFPEAPGAAVLFKFAVLNYFVVLLNLLPLLELDGYYILSDLIHVPDLRQRSLSFMRDDLPRKFRHWDGLTKQDVGLGVYSVLGVVFTIFCLWTSVFFWRQVFGGLVSDLWNGGIWTRLLLLALAVFLLGPVLRGLISVGRAVYARARALWRRIVFRAQTSWRVDAAELIDALPTFDDLPEDVLSDLAGRVQLRSFPQGKPVVRQGERARGFYVVRHGTLQVVEELPDGGERSLRVLGRGESFGELGLVGTAPRAATVRALERSEVFEIDKGTFDHLLAQSVHLPEFGPTVQAALELRALPAFDHLELDELSEVLEHGSWRSIAPGEVVIEQGQVGDSFYALGSGKVDIVRDGELVSTLGPGEYFGEVALLLEIPRTASVVARTPGRVFELEREGFDRLVGQAFKGGTLKPHSGADRTATH